MTSDSFLGHTAQPFHIEIRLTSRREELASQHHPVKATLPAYNTAPQSQLTLLNITQNHETSPLGTYL
jgi:hypothetical protein